MKHKELVETLGKINCGLEFWAEMMLDSKHLKKKHWPGGAQEVASSIQSYITISVTGDSNECMLCGTPMIPAKDCKNFNTGKWDGYSYKFNCDCNSNKDLRICIG